jgi:hypothetical protein
MAEVSSENRAYFQASDVLERLGNQLDEQETMPEPTVRALMAIGYGLLAVVDELETLSRTLGVES